jgi:hypothetical protein
MVAIPGINTTRVLVSLNLVAIPGISNSERCHPVLTVVPGELNERLPRSRLSSEARVALRLGMTVRHHSFSPWCNPYEVVMALMIGRGPSGGLRPCYETAEDFESSVAGRTHSARVPKRAQDRNQNGTKRYAVENRRLFAT